jgi:hypothetical protein
MGVCYVCLVGNGVYYVYCGFNGASVGLKNLILYDKDARYQQCETARYISLSPSLNQFEEVFLPNFTCVFTMI